MSVCMSAHMFQKIHVHISQNSLHVTFGPGSVSSDVSAIRYVLPVLSMTSCFHVMGLLGRNQRQHYVTPSSPDGATGVEVAVYDWRLATVATIVKIIVQIVH